MTLNRALQRKRLIAGGMVFIIIALVAVQMFLKADTKQVIENRPVTTLENTEPGLEKQTASMQVQAESESGAEKIVSVQEKMAPRTEKQTAVQDQEEPAYTAAVSSLPGGTRPGVVEKQIQQMPAIDYKNLDKGSALDQVMEKRLHAMGISKSLDMIIRSDESFTVGDKKVSMTDILAKAYAQKQKIFQTRITEFEETVPERIQEYGIYVVQPGDNIWNIHFNILKEYYASRAIHVTPDADEPLDTGQSSGVGKILKFSEIMVIIYNMVEEKIVTDIDLIEPLSKIVIYNMDEVFALLSEICFDQIDQIQFDGRTIWIPDPKT
jgi:hypothetical protein